MSTQSCDCAIRDIVLRTPSISYSFLLFFFFNAQTRRLSLSQPKHDYKVSKKVEIKGGKL